MDKLRYMYFKIMNECMVKTILLCKLDLISQSFCKAVKAHILAFLNKHLFYNTPEIMEMVTKNLSRGMHKILK